MLEATGCYQIRNAAVRGVFPDFEPDLPWKIVLASDPLKGELLHFFQLVVRTRGERVTPARMQDLLRDALGDPTLELALWDLCGKECGQPLYRLFGGSLRDEVDYFYYLARGTPEEIVRQLYLRKLMDPSGYGYPKDRLAVEKPVAYGVAL